MDVVTVQCQRCGDRYETTLPLAGIARVRRCRSCGRRTLELVDDAAREPDGPADDGPEASRHKRESGHA